MKRLFRCSSCRAMVALILLGALPCLAKVKVGPTQKVIDIPLQNYTVLDISGTHASSDVTLVALDDNNHAAFSYMSAATSLTVKTWSNGVVTDNQTVTLVFDQSRNLGNISLIGKTVPLTDRVMCSGPKVLLPSGKIYGDYYAEASVWESDETHWGVWEGIYLSYAAENGQVVLMGSNAPSDLLPSVAYWTAKMALYAPLVDPNGGGYLADYTIVGASPNGTICGWDMDGTPNSFSGFLGYAGSTYLWNSSFWNSESPQPSGTVECGEPGYPVAVNDSGQAIFGNDGNTRRPDWYQWSGDANPYAVWTGSNMVTLPGNPIGINNQCRVIGTESTTDDGYLWHSGTGGNGTVALIKDLLNVTGFKQWLPQIGTIYPRFITNANPADGSVTIIFDALNQEDDDGLIWQWEMFALKLDASLNPTKLSIVQLPDGVTTGLAGVNACGTFCAIGKPTAATTTNHALLLVPFEFNELNPASGFDKYTKPNWLMVPKDQTNWAKAITPANAEMEIKFKVIPESGSTTITPASTHQSPVTIGASSPTVGNDTSVVIGIGTAFGTEGLKVAVKKYRHKNVAIHAVTQRYTTPMSLNPNANPPEGKPNQVCVRPKPNASIIGASEENRGGDDIFNSNDGTIDAGPNGVCESNANTQYDDQVIPVGQGICKDLVPQGVPSASDFETYINHIFGLQANIYFTVSRLDAVVDYDTIQPRNKMLDMTGTRSFGPEEVALRNGAGTPEADVNVYFVYEFNYGAAIGKAVPSDIAYVDVKKSGSSDLRQVAAHEIGHDLGIAYHADQFPNFNPGYLPGKSPKRRLMNSTTEQDTDNVLIKAEWDLINKDNLP